MQDRTRSALRWSGRAVVQVLAALFFAVIIGASAGLMLFCLGWWVLG